MQESAVYLIFPVVETVPIPKYFLAVQCKVIQTVIHEILHEVCRIRDDCFHVILILLITLTTFVIKTGSGNEDVIQKQRILGHILCYLRNQVHLPVLIHQALRHTYDKVHIYFTVTFGYGLVLCEHADFRQCITGDVTAVLIFGGNGNIRLFTVFLELDLARHIHYSGVHGLSRLA